MKSKRVSLLVLLAGWTACSFSQVISVSVSSPTNNATVSSPVHVAATASSKRAYISRWAVSADNAQVYTAGQATSLSTDVALSSGTHQLVITAWDSKGRSASASRSVTVPSTTSPAPSPAPLSIATTSLPGSTVGIAYSVTLTASGGTTPYSWTVASGQIPPGLALSSSGTIQGTPTTAGQFTFTVQVKDSTAAPQTASTSYTLSVAAPASTPLTITVNSLPDGTVGTAYSAALTASGGTPPYTWTIVSGQMPPGVALASSGSIGGTPTTAGQDSFTVQVKDSATNNQQAAQSSFTISVANSTTNSATLLFKSGFGTGISLPAPFSCGSTECYQQVSGTDASTGFTWPPNIWGGTNMWAKGGFLQLIADTSITSSTISNYVVNQLQTVTGHDGSSTTALYQQTLGSAYQGNASRQAPYIITPDVTVAQGDLYVREWIKLEPNLTTELISGQFADGSWGDWRVVSEWKTGGQAMGGTTGCVPSAPTYGGDYRIISFIIMDNSGNLFWRTQGDNNANGGLPFTTFWQVDNHTVPVPVGQWFKYEWFWHRSANSDGRAWAAVDGQVIADHYGPNMGAYNCPINRIVPFTVYTGGYFPAYQWVDDLEIWNTFPADATSH